MRILRERVVAISVAGAIAFSGAAFLGGPSASAAVKAPSTAAFSATLLITKTGSTPVDATATGVADFKTDEATVTINFPNTLKPALSLLGTLASAVAGADPDTHISASVIGGTLYATIPGFKLTTKTIVGIPFGTTALDPIFTKDAKFITNGKKGLSSVASGKVKSIGKAKVDGAKAQGYGAKVPTTKVLGLIPAIGNVLELAAPKDFGTSIPVQVWVNKKGEMVELKILVTRAGTTTGIQKLDLALTFTKFGVAAPSVTTPAATTVETITTTILKALGGASSPTTTAAG